MNRVTLDVGAASIAVAGPRTPTVLPAVALPGGDGTWSVGSAAFREPARAPELVAALDVPVPGLLAAVERAFDGSVAALVARRPPTGGEIGEAAVLDRGRALALRLRARGVAAGDGPVLVVDVGHGIELGLVEVLPEVRVLSWHREPGAGGVLLEDAVLAAVPAADDLVARVRARHAVDLLARGSDLGAPGLPHPEALTPAIADLAAAVLRAVTASGHEGRVHLVGGCLRPGRVRDALLETLRQHAVTVDPEPAAAAALGALLTLPERPAPLGGWRGTPGPPPRPSAPPQPEPPQPEPSPPEPSRQLPVQLAPGDDARITVYRPTELTAGREHPVLVFVHLGRPFRDRDTGRQRDPVGEVREQARRALASEPGAFDAVVTDSRVGLDTGDELTVAVWLEEGSAAPPHAVLRWTEPVHRVEFRVRTDAAPGRRLRGGVRVFRGLVLVGEVTFTGTVVDRPSSSEPAEVTERTTVALYRRVFVSYAHRDGAVVSRILAYLAATGDRFVRDVHDLRAGDRWESRLDQLIEQADVFQLFWSHRAMRSAQVRREWEFALALGREGFVRPVYWEVPRPADAACGLPPPALDALHWARLPLPAPDAWHQERDPSAWYGKRDPFDWSDPGSGSEPAELFRRRSPVAAVLVAVVLVGLVVALAFLFRLL